MSQVVHGLQLTNGIFHLFGHGAPSSRSDMWEMFAAQPGSLYSRTDGVASTVLYACVVGGTPPTGGSVGVLSQWNAVA
jgi:hypothetical protein